MGLIARLNGLIFGARQLPPEITEETTTQPAPFYTKDFITNPGYEIGDHTYGNPGVYDWNEGTKLVIGKYTAIASEVTIILGGNHRTEWASMYPFPNLKDKWPKADGITGHPYSKGDVVIGNDVWVGTGATILSGVTVGDGAVIAARSVVVKDVPPYTIVGGNPAKELKKRFSDAQIKKLLELKWWDWPDEKVNQNVKLLCSGDIDGLARAAKTKTEEVSQPSYVGDVSREFA